MALLLPNRNQGKHHYLVAKLAHKARWRVHLTRKLPWTECHEGWIKTPPGFDTISPTHPSKYLARLLSLEYSILNTGTCWVINQLNNMCTRLDSMMFFSIFTEQSPTLPTPLPTMPLQRYMYDMQYWNNVANAHNICIIVSCVTVVLQHVLNVHLQ